MFGRRKQPEIPDPLAWRKSGVPLTSNAHRDPSDFYLPPLAGAATFARAAMTPATLRSVCEILDRLTPDAYSRFLTSFLREGMTRHGDGWEYADLSTVLHALGSLLAPQRYLEIGVRRGRSMAMIAATAPECAMLGFDLWIENYAGMDNPGPDFVRGELASLGFRGTVELISGDSHETVPRYFREHPDAHFDVITVDGDHTLDGARADLETVIPRLKIGGALVFDDVSSQYHPYLGDLWDEIVRDRCRWSSWRFDDVGFGIGFAIRKQ